MTAKSVWNTKYSSSRKKIKIKKVIRRWPEYADGFPGMEILDTKSKRHIVAFVDLHCSLEEWEKISEGREIVLIMREAPIGAVLLPSISPAKKRKELEIPKSPYYRWTCKACKGTGIVSYEEWGKPLEVGQRIVKAHEKPKPVCREESFFKVIDHTGQDKTEEFNQIMGFKSKLS